MPITTKATRSAAIKIPANAEKSNPGKPTPERRPKPERYAAFARNTLNESLESLMEEFIKSGLPEEKHFMTEVLQDWQCTSGRSGAKRLGTHEVPLYSAIQYQAGD